MSCNSVLLTMHSWVSVDVSALRFIRFYCPCRFLICFRIAGVVLGYGLGHGEFYLKFLFMVSRRPRIGAGYRFIDTITEPNRLSRRCEVTAILILYGFPRLLTGSILAHEMMHAWLRLKGYPNLRPDVEEGICQVLAHMWLDSEIYSSSGDGASSSSSSSPSSSSPTSSNKGKRSDFEKKLGEFFKHQIESDTSSAYGDGFRSGNQAVGKYGLRSTLEHIWLTGTFPV